MWESTELPSVMSNRAAILAVGVCLVLAGCSGAGLGSSGDAASAEAGGQQQSSDLAAESSSSFDRSQSGGDGGDAGDGGSVSDLQRQRAIIKTGSMTVEVENFSTARAAITDYVRQQGGYVSGSDQRLHRTGNTTWLTGHVVVRVPSDQYEATQSVVADQGTVRSEETETEDVTDQLVDLEARLENLRSRRDRLREFYDRAETTEELLEIEAELSEVQGEIERLEAQKRSLEQRVAYSTIRVELREPSPGADQLRTQYHEQSLVAVFTRSVTDLVIFARASLVTIVAALPWLAVLAVPVVGLRRFLRGRSLPLVGGGGEPDDTAADTKNEPDETATDEQDN